MVAFLLAMQSTGMVICHGLRHKGGKSKPIEVDVGGFSFGVWKFRRMERTVGRHRCHLELNLQRCDRRVKSTVLAVSIHNKMDDDDLVGSTVNWLETGMPFQHVVVLHFTLS